MPVHNSDIAKIFTKLADLLEIEGANPFRIRAYRDAARTIEGLARNVAEMLAAGEDLTQLAGIGKDLAGKIAEIVGRGKLTQLEEIEKRLPGQLGELLELPGLGPKRVKILYQKLGIADRAGLESAAREGKVSQLEGFGAKTEQKILEELAKRPAGEKRNRLVDVEEFAESLTDYLRQTPGVKQVIAAGSYRRRKETVGDLDILVTCRRGSPVMDRFAAYEDVAEVVSKGTTRSTVRLRTGLQVDLRVVAETSYGAALHYFTGSKAHNIAVRKIGVAKGLKINEYGVFRGRASIAGRTEKEVFDQVGLAYVEPELREDRGEIEAAKRGTLPKLIARPTSAATCTATPTPATADIRSKKWSKPRGSAAINTWPSPTTRNA